MLLKAFSLITVYKYIHSTMGRFHSMKGSEETLAPEAVSTTFPSIYLFQQLLTQYTIVGTGDIKPEIYHTHPQTQLLPRRTPCNTMLKSHHRTTRRWLWYQQTRILKSKGAKGLRPNRRRHIVILRSTIGATSGLFSASSLVLRAALFVPYLRRSLGVRTPKRAAKKEVTRAHDTN
jgi:hypothetical protein